MQSDTVEGDVKPAGQSSIPSAVQGVPWWGGVAQQTLPMDFMYPQTMQQVPAQVVGSTLSEGQGPAPSLLSLGQSVVYVDGSSNGNQPQPGTPAILPPAATDYVLPHTQLELGQGMARAYGDPYYNGIVATYGVQAMIHPQMLGIQQVRMALPSEITEEEPVYVNAKQYRGIMRRRESRAKAESENKLAKSRKPYLHESRHLHAMRRARGCGGRFLNTKTKDESKANSDSTRSSGGQSPGVVDENDSGQTGCVRANGSQQRAVPTQ